jgi:hypothetical protein
VTVAALVIAIVEPSAIVRVLALKQAVDVSALQSTQPLWIVRLSTEDRPPEAKVPGPIPEYGELTVILPPAMVKL